MRAHQKSEVELWKSWCDDHGVQHDAATVIDVCCFYFDVLPSRSMPVRQTLSNALREVYPVFNEVKLPYPLLTRYVGVSLQQIVEAASSLPPEQRCWVYLVALCRLKADEAEAWAGDPGPKRGLVRLPGRSVPVPFAVWDALKVEAERPPAWPWSVADMHAALAVAAADLPEITRVAVWGRWSAMRVKAADRYRGWFGT